MAGASEEIIPGAHLLAAIGERTAPKRLPPLVRAEESVLDVSCPLEPECTPAPSRYRQPAGGSPHRREGLKPCQKKHDRPFP